MTEPETLRSRESQRIDSEQGLSALSEIINGLDLRAVDNVYINGIKTGLKPLDIEIIPMYLMNLKE